MNLPPMYDAVRALFDRAPDLAAFTHTPATWHVDRDGIAHSGTGNDERIAVTGTLADWLQTRVCPGSHCRSVHKVAGAAGSTVGEACQVIVSLERDSEHALGLLPGQPAQALGAATKAHQRATRALANLGEPAGSLRGQGHALLAGIADAAGRAEAVLRSPEHRQRLAAGCALELAEGDTGPVGDLRLLATGSRTEVSFTYYEASGALKFIDITADAAPTIAGTVDTREPVMVSQIAHPFVAARAAGLTGSGHLTVGDVTTSLTDAWRAAVRDTCTELPARIREHADSLLADPGMHLVYRQRATQANARTQELIAAYAIVPGHPDVLLAPHAVTAWLVDAAETLVTTVPVDPDAPGFAVRAETAAALLADGGVYADLPTAWAAAGQLA